MLFVFKFIELPFMKTPEIVSLAIFLFYKKPYSAFETAIVLFIYVLTKSSENETHFLVTSVIAMKIF